MRYILFSLVMLMAVTLWATEEVQKTSQPGQVPGAESTMTDTAAAKASIPEKMPKSDSMKTSTDTTKAGKAVKSAPKDKETMSPDKGIGPITEVTLGPIDSKMANQGKTLFNNICTACHALDKKMVGPPLREITEQRTPEFIMNMLLNTQEMQDKDPEVKKLIAEYKVLMAIPKLSQDQARQLLEYLRQADQQKPAKK